MRIDPRVHFRVITESCSSLASCLRRLLAAISQELSRLRRSAGSSRVIRYFKIPLLDMSFNSTNKLAADSGMPFAAGLCISKCGFRMDRRNFVFSKCLEQFFYCSACGNHFQADINAARNIINLQDSSAIPGRMRNSWLHYPAKNERSPSGYVNNPDN
ncbi:MAG: hypothetical protein EAX81_07610 [Candidatus Thorarchaeota archaeon]|nr:hypothetical protein [Candidatus Thorarchaeota archaeon]